MRKANDDTQYSPSQTDDSETGAPKHHGAIILNPEDNRIFLARRTNLRYRTENGKC